MFVCTQSQGTGYPGNGVVCVCGHRSPCHGGPCHVEACRCLEFEAVVCNGEVVANSERCAYTEYDVACGDLRVLHCDAADPTVDHICNVEKHHHPFSPGWSHVVEPRWEHTPRYVRSI